MKIKCYSVRLKSLVSISNKAYKAESFDGSVDIIPKSQVYGRDFDVVKSDAYWISAWILERKTIQYSRKKTALFYNDTRRMAPSVIVSTHIPKEILNAPNYDKSLKRSTDSNRQA